MIYPRYAWVLVEQRPKTGIRGLFGAKEGTTYGILLSFYALLLNVSFVAYAACHYDVIKENTVFYTRSCIWLSQALVHTHNTEHKSKPRQVCHRLHPDIYYRRLAAFNCHRLHLSHVCRWYRCITHQGRIVLHLQLPHARQASTNTEASKHHLRQWCLATQYKNLISVDMYETAECDKQPPYSVRHTKGPKKRITDYQVKRQIPNPIIDYCQGKTATPSYIINNCQKRQSQLPPWTIANVKRQALIP